MKNLKQAEALFDAAIVALPMPYKALLVASAFSALNDTKAVKLVADENDCAVPAELAKAAGIFLDLRVLFDGVDWQTQLYQHIDVARIMNVDTGKWNPPFSTKSQDHQSLGKLVDNVRLLLSAIEEGDPQTISEHYQFVKRELPLEDNDSNAVVDHDDDNEDPNAVRSSP
ncbi:MAG: hypothetical protein Q7K26_01560 [bacterium]|nr:hypothetical protein [bacterium]